MKNNYGPALFGNYSKKRKQNLTNISLGIYVYAFAQFLSWKKSTTSSQSNDFLFDLMYSCPLQQKHLLLENFGHSHAYLDIIKRKSYDLFESVEVSF